MFLYVSDQIEKSRALVQHLSEHGFFFFHASLQAAEFVLDEKDVGGVILDCIPDLKAGEHLCQIIRASYPAIPLAAIVLGQSVPNLCADQLLRDNGHHEELAAHLYDFLLSCNGTADLTLSTPALRIDPLEHTVLYLGYPLKLSKTEFRILHCLFYRAPRATTVDDLMSLCFVGKDITVSNLRVQIHRINRLAARISPTPLILCTPKGYLLRDGIV